MPEARSSQSRCHHPLGSSGALAVFCALPVEHAGPHHSSFDLAKPLPRGVGAPTISEAPEVRISESTSGKKSVWIEGVGYLSTAERHELGRWLAGQRQWRTPSDER